jgi:hypothetical protein
VRTEFVGGGAINEAAAMQLLLDANESAQKADALSIVRLIYGKCATSSLGIVSTTSVDMVGGLF